RMVIDGQEGWGETAPYRSPQYSSEWCDGAFSLLHDWLTPAIIGREVASGEALAELLAPFKGNQFAKAGLDLAWWDAHARLEGQPLWQLIGGTDNRVEVGADIAVLSDIDALITEIAKAQEAGFKRTKLKFARAGMSAWCAACVKPSLTRWSTSTATAVSRWTICRCFANSTASGWP
ncbi:MAG TPA: hypothetical protein VK035_01385, partial [Kiloniellales bacterium]|nr:hypothetical protein [Kiloniellales bacterium]